MPRYFFDARDNFNFVIDDIGVELPSLGHAKIEAARALAELAFEVVPGSLRRLLTIEVRDDGGPRIERTGTRDWRNEVMVQTPVPLPLVGRG